MPDATKRKPNQAGAITPRRCTTSESRDYSFPEMKGRDGEYESVVDDDHARRSVIKRTGDVYSYGNTS